MKNESDLFNEINELCEEERLENAGKEGVDSDQNISGIYREEENFQFNMSNIANCKAGDSDTLMDNMELNSLIQTFTKVDLKVMEDILEKMR